MSQQPSTVSHLSGYERRTTLRVSRRDQSTPHEDRPAPRKFTAKGHDSQLQDAQYGCHPVEVLTLHGEDSLKGVISRRDKYTITLKLSGGTDAGKELIIYKHAIESILISKEA